MEETKKNRSVTHRDGAARKLPSGNVFWRVTTLRLVVENLSRCAAQLARFDSVEANVELLTIFWVREVRMGDDLTRLVVLALVFRALEAVFQLFLGFDASLAVRILGPDACAGVFVEVESTRALILDVLAVNARVEHVAGGWVGMSEESILSWAEIVLSLRRLCGWQLGD